MAIDKLFKEGNYNEWDKFVRETLPSIDESIENNLLVNLDQALISMLGPTLTVEKESINVTQVINDQKLSGIKIEIIYTVKDWVVPGCPEEAVDQDTDALLNYIQNDLIEITYLNIDTNIGRLTIQAEVRF